MLLNLIKDSKIIITFIKKGMSTAKYIINFIWFFSFITKTSKNKGVNPQNLFFEVLHHYYTYKNPVFQSLYRINLISALVLKFLYISFQIRTLYIDKTMPHKVTPILINYKQELIEDNAKCNWTKLFA